MNNPILILDESENNILASQYIIDNIPTGYEVKWFKNINDLSLQSEQISMFGQCLIYVIPDDIKNSYIWKSVLKDLTIVSNNIIYFISDTEDYIKMFEAMVDLRIDNEIDFVVDLLDDKFITYDKNLIPELLINMYNANLFSLKSTIEAMPDSITLNFDNIETYCTNYEKSTPFSFLKSMCWGNDTQLSLYHLNNLRNSKYLLLYMRKVMVNAITKRNATYNALGDETCKHLYQVSHACWTIEKFLPYLIQVIIDRNEKG